MKKNILKIASLIALAVLVGVTAFVLQHGKNGNNTTLWTYVAEEYYSVIELVDNGQIANTKYALPFIWEYNAQEDTLYIWDYSSNQPTDDIREFALLCMEELDITHYEPQVYTVDLRGYGNGFILYAVEC